MKNSNIEWIGKIPDNWYTAKYKYFSKSRMGETILITDTIDDGIPVYSATQGDAFLGYVSSANVVLHKNDIVIPARGNSIGCAKIVQANKATCTQTTICSTGIHNIDAKFLYYCCHGLKEYWFQYDGSAIPQITVSQVENNTLAVPPLEVQKLIANFLDKKCSEIDGLMFDIQSQIDMLEEYKKSIITEAVTKGLNPDVEMKDSGIEWIGMIPKHWDVHPVGYYFSERKNKNALLEEQNLLSLSYGKIVRKDINSLGGLLPESFNTYNIVESNDIIIRPTDLQNDKRSLRTGLVTEHGIITSAYIDLMPKANVNSKYFHYLLHSYDVTKVFYNMGNGVRQGLNYSEFAKLMVFAPPTQEQQEIANHLDAKCAEIDAVIADKKAQLETLTEYKKSFIYEYVTGKKEVPHA